MTPRRATAWPVVAKRVLALAGAFCGHAIRQRRHSRKEVRRRDSGLEAVTLNATATTIGAAAPVTVAFQIDFFKVQRPVTQTRRIPGVAELGPAAGVAILAGLIDL